MNRNLYYTIIFISLISSCQSSEDNSIADELSITVSGASREFSFTNKYFGQYYGETNFYFRNGWQGWTLREQRVFNDYSIYIDSLPLPRENSEAAVLPYLLTRKYKGIIEKFFFADSLDLVLIELSGIDKQKLSFQLFNLPSTDFSIENGFVKIDMKNVFEPFSLFIGSNAVIKNVKTEGKNIKFDIDKKSNNAIKIILLAAESSDKLQQFLNHSENLIDKKKQRLEDLLQSVNIESNDEGFNKAFKWAIVSIDALITKQNMAGIFAGLPWFNNYWGRDTFISLEGAALSIGNFAAAREILFSFAKAQNIDPYSKYYGRIPNRVTLTEKIYNTADGTPWFVIQCSNYFKYTNDTLFLREIYPAVKVAFNASVEKHIDKLGFLTHGDAETWMDAVGPNGPWSPRGNRADDIQALWYRQLKITEEMAIFFQDEETAAKCRKISSRLKFNFQKYFVDAKANIIYDHLNEDGTADSSIRPNLFFVLNEAELIPFPEMRISILANAMKNLVLPYGVISLSMNDPNFHPYHQYQPFYVKDEAYHNGIVWTWLSGPVIQNLCAAGLADSAWVLTKHLTNQILEEGAAGTISELTDAFPRPGEKTARLSGTFSQAWSLAEYIRNIFRSYFGVSVDAPNKKLILTPSLPSALKNVEFSQNISDNKVKIKYETDYDYFRITLYGNDLEDSISMEVNVKNKVNSIVHFKFSLRRKDKIVIEVPALNDKKNIYLLRNGKKEDIIPTVTKNEYASEKLKEINFAPTVMRSDLRSLKGPDYLLLEHSDVKKSGAHMRQIFSATDAEDNESYQYPANPIFQDGIADLTYFQLDEDSSNYFFKLKFKNLIDPGWHREYGFQLTFVSICLRTDGSSKKSREPGFNSNYFLSRERAFNYIINIGGGIEVRDASNKILAAYLPKEEDIFNPLGNVERKEISFSLPKNLLGTVAENSVLTLLIGVQDDHGGAGIGEFRTVSKTASEWKGGGKKFPQMSNVYDQLFIN